MKASHDQSGGSEHHQGVSHDQPVTRFDPGIGQGVRPRVDDDPIVAAVRVPVGSHVRSRVAVRLGGVDRRVEGIPLSERRCRPGYEEEEGERSDGEEFAHIQSVPKSWE